MRISDWSSDVCSSDLINNRECFYKINNMPSGCDAEQKSTKFRGHGCAASGGEEKVTRQTMLSSRAQKLDAPASAALVATTFLKSCVRQPNVVRWEERWVGKGCISRGRYRGGQG